MIASTPTPYRTFIQSTRVPAEGQAAKAEALRIADLLDAAVARSNAAAGPAAAGAPAGGSSAAAADPATEINGLLEQLAEATGRFFPGSARSSPPVYGPQHQGKYGSSVRVERLTRSIRNQGGAPTAGHEHWSQLLRRKQGGRSFYVRGHLLNHNIGGPGNNWDNLTPMYQNENTGFETSFESHVKEAVLAGSTVNFTVTVEYSRGLNPAHAEMAEGNAHEREVAEVMQAECIVPSRVQASATSVEGATPAVSKSHTIPYSFSCNPNDYLLRATPRTRVYLSGLMPEQIQSNFGITLDQATRIKDVVASRRPRRWQSLLDACVPSDAGPVNAIRNADRYDVKLFER
jgi:hypothetical protein